jgi:hypothetical protein
MVVLDVFGRNSDKVSEHEEIRITKRRERWRRHMLMALS